MESCPNCRRELYLDHSSKGSWCLNGCWIPKTKPKPMICKYCKDGHHFGCQGGTWCDCQHREELIAQTIQESEGQGDGANSPQEMEEGIPEMPGS